jgi:hypothetical protein
MRRRSQPTIVPLAWQLALPLRAGVSPLAVEAGMTTRAVADSLGHESFTTTAQSHAKPRPCTEHVRRALLRGRRDALEGGSSGPEFRTTKGPRIPAGPLPFSVELWRVRFRVFLNNYQWLSRRFR